MWHIRSIFYQNPHIRYVYIYIYVQYIYIYYMYIYIYVKYIYIYVKYIYIYVKYIIYIYIILHIFYLYLTYYIYVYIYTPHIHSILHKDYQRNHSSSNNRLGCWENHPSPATGGGGTIWLGGGGWGSFVCRGAKLAGEFAYLRGVSWMSKCRGFHVTWWSLWFLGDATWQSQLTYVYIYIRIYVYIYMYIYIYVYIWLYMYICI